VYESVCRYLYSNITTNSDQKIKTCDLGHFGKQRIHFYIGNKKNVEMIAKTSTCTENKTIWTIILNRYLNNMAFSDSSLNPFSFYKIFTRCLGLNKIH